MHLDGQMLRVNGLRRVGFGGDCGMGVGVRYLQQGLRRSKVMVLGVQEVFIVMEPACHFRRRVKGMGRRLRRLSTNGPRSVQKKTRMGNWLQHLVINGPHLAQKARMGQHRTSCRQALKNQNIGDSSSPRYLRLLLQRCRPRVEFVSVGNLQKP